MVIYLMNMVDGYPLNVHFSRAYHCACFYCASTTTIRATVLWQFLNLSLVCKPPRGSQVQTIQVVSVKD